MNVQIFLKDKNNEPALVLSSCLEEGFVEILLIGNVVEGEVNSTMRKVSIDDLRLALRKMVAK